MLIAPRLKYPRDITKYRIVKKNEISSNDIGGYQPNPIFPIYIVEYNDGFLFFNDWIRVGPSYFDTVKGAYSWIQNVVYSSLEPKELVVWSGKYSQNPPN